ncbi:hypothetical protein [Clostridium estertheticum]|nr:hypothetical protein [Clostridium estertheticum]
MDDEFRADMDDGMKLCASKGILCPNVLAYDLIGKSMYQSQM